MPRTATGTLIRKARQRRQYTQQELADKLDVSRWTVVMWESGRIYPLRYTARLEDALGIVLPEPEEVAG